MKQFCLSAALVLMAWSLPTTADDLLIDDFETADLGNWSITGDAFGSQPAEGSLPGSQQFS